MQVTANCFGPVGPHQRGMAIVMVVASHTEKEKCMYGHATVNPRVQWALSSSASLVLSHLTQQ